LAPHRVIGRTTSPRGRRDDIEMHCLIVHRHRARGLLRVGRRLLHTVAGSANCLGWLGSGSHRERRRIQAETKFATQSGDHRWTVERRGRAVRLQISTGRSMVGGTSGRERRRREAEQETHNMCQLLAAGAGLVAMVVCLKIHGLRFANAIAQLRFCPRSEL